ncbi:MAG: Integral rane sensor signal transduction histidine kinase [Verrucomicrobiales bacterium]|nr:Integral rane sensor signal transduction histidine kinase [Verrucomicrobiales bacterium]
MNPKSLRFQLMAWYGTLLVIAFLIFSASIYFTLEHFLRQNIATALLNRATQISDNVLADYKGHSLDWLKFEVDSRHAPQNSGRFIRIIKNGSEILYVSEAPKDESFDPASIPLQPLNPHVPIRIVSSNKDQLLIRTFYTLMDGATLTVEVGRSIVPIQETMRGIVLSLIVSGPLVIGVAVFGAYILVGRALSPVDRIIASAERITLEHLANRLPVPATGDELERLSNALNRMIERIDLAFKTDKRFIADASHELRTPIAIIRAELEALGGSKALHDSTRERVGSILEEVQRLGRTVEALFAIARLDAGEAQSEWKSIDLSKLVELTTDQMCLLAEDKMLTVETDLPEGVFIIGDQQRLKQIIVNLLDNAIKYTPEGGKIRISVAAMLFDAVLQISDTGIGIPVECRDRVFDRFYRVDSAKNMNEGGAGLGLSIVKSICTAHYAKISVSSHLEAGCCFKVAFPLHTEKK